MKYKVAVEEFLRGQKASEIVRHGVPGKRYRMRLHGKLQEGLALEVDSNMVHLYSFPN